MSKNPLINAACAMGYILLIGMVMNYIVKTQSHKPDTAFAPIIFLSMLTLSVTIMAYVFFYQPLLLFIDGKKKEAVNLFLQTVAIFGAMTVIVSILLFSGLI